LCLTEISTLYERVDCFCGQWQKTVWLVCNEKLTLGLTCPPSYINANELIFLRISSNWNFVVSSIMVSTRDKEKRRKDREVFWSLRNILQTCRNVSVSSTNRAPNVSCCDNSHVTMLLPCSDTKLLLAFNSESFVKVRAVARSANSPHSQFYFCKELSRVCVVAGRIARRLQTFQGFPHRIYRRQNFNEHLQDCVLNVRWCVGTLSWEITFTAIHGDAVSAR
jgi:hypothetical protein